MRAQDPEEDRLLHFPVSDHITYKTVPLQWPLHRAMCLGFWCVGGWEGDTALKVVDYPKLVDITQHCNCFLARPFGHPRGFKFEMQITTGCGFSYQVLPVV